MKTQFKVCCIQSSEEAALAISCGASALGLVSAMPSGPGPIPEERIAEIAATVPAHIDTFLLTALTEADAIIAQHRRCGCNTLQLVDAVPFEDLKKIREVIPQAKLVQVIHVTGEESIQEALAVAPLVDAVLLDSGNPNAAVKELGGTGRVHNWTHSKKIVETVGKPVYLAGGLNPDNAADAIRAVRPHALDICSGLRIDGLLDETKLQRFAIAVNSL